MNALETVLAVQMGSDTARLWSDHLASLVDAKAPDGLTSPGPATAAAWRTLVSTVALTTANPGGVSDGDAHVLATADRLALFIRTKQEVYGVLPSLSALIDHDPED